MTGVLDLFLPREHRFFDMFQELFESISFGSDRFVMFIKNYGKLSRRQKEDFVKLIKSVEKKCDRLTHRLSTELNSTFITPFDREDMHKLATLMDDIMDLMFNVSDKMVLYNIRKLPPYISELSTIGRECIKEIGLLLYALRSKHKIGSSLQKVHELEVAADSLRNTAFAHLFSNRIKPVDIIKFKDLCESLEMITDKCEDVADVVENIVIKHG